MKNKVVSIVCVVLIIAAIICFGYIFINSKENIFLRSERIT